MEKQFEDLECLEIIGEIECEVEEIIITDDLEVLQENLGGVIPPKTDKKKSVL